MILFTITTLIFAFTSFASATLSRSNSAQTADISIAGTITDKSHKFIANLKVKAVNELTKKCRRTRTNQSGYFEFTGLPPGHYALVFGTKNKLMPNRTAELELGLNGGVIYNTSLDMK